MSPSRRGLLLTAVLLLAPGCAHAPARPAPAPARPALTVRRLPAREAVLATVGTPAMLGRLLREAVTRGRAAGWRFTGPPMLLVSAAGERRLALPVAGRPRVAPPFTLGPLPAARAVVRTVHGTLAEVEGQARRLRRAVAAGGLTPAGPLVLVLVDDPTATAPASRRTRIVIPLR